MVYCQTASGNAGMAELADARDLKSRETHLSYRFKPGFRHQTVFPQTNQYRGVEQLVARRAHNPEVGGSSPSPATMLCNQKRYCTGKPRNHNGFWAFSYPDFQVQTKRYFSLLRGLELPTPTISGDFREDFSSESRLFFVFAENFF